MQIAVLAAEHDPAVVGPMIAAAGDEAARRGATVAAVVRVPGAYEIPLPLSRLLRRRDVDGAVVLGWIERGETLHGEVMGHVVGRAVVELSLARGKPVGIGIVGPGATREQAQARAERHARAAVRAAIAGLEALREAAGPAKRRRR